MKRLTLTLALLLAILPASLLLAGAEGRLKGVVQDNDGKGIVGAQVVLMAQEVSATRQAKTKKGGKFVMLVADATRSYMIRIEADGYQTIQEPIKFNIGGQIEKTWTLLEGETVAGASVVEVHEPGAKVYNEGAKAFNNGDIDKALEKFIEAGEESAAEGKPLVEAFQGQAMIHWSRKDMAVDDAEKERLRAVALEAAEKAVEIDPSNVVGLRIRYDAYSEVEDERAPEALDALVAADKSSGTARRVFNVGVAAVRANDLQGAIDRFEQAVEVDPTLRQAHEILGQLYNNNQQYTEAIATAEQVLALDPASTKAHSILYEAYKATGDTAKAQASWAVLKEADPQDLARALADDGQSLFQAGNIAAATEKLEQAVEAYPEHPTAHYTLGLCYLNGGRQALAKQHLEKFVALNPDHPEAATARDMIQYIQ